MKYIFGMIFSLCLLNSVFSNEIIFLSSLKTKNNIIYQDILKAYFPSFKIEKMGQLTSNFSFAMGNYDKNNIFICSYKGIYLFNLQNKSLKKFNDLIYQTVFTDINKIIFVKSENYKSYLFVGSINKDFLKNKKIYNVKKIALVWPNNNYISIFRISTDEIAFLYNQKDSIIGIYNINSGIFKSVKIDNCYPELWRDKTKQFICSNQQDGHIHEYFYADKNGKIGKYFKLRAKMMIYFPDSDSAGINVPKYFSDDYYSAMYDFSTGKIKKIPDNIFLDIGSAIYIN